MTLYTTVESKPVDGDHDLANKTYNMNDIYKIFPAFPPDIAATAEF